MSATAATIRIALEAQTAGLKVGMAQGKRAIDDLGKGMSGHVAAGMAKFTAGLAGITAGLMSVRAIIGQVQAAMGSMDETSKFAARIGLAADQLEILNYAAEQSGASAGTMQMGLQRMTRRVNEAAHGTGEAVKALQELGLSAEYLTGLSPDKQFGAIADAMAGVSGQGDKVRLAMKLFDSEGVALVNTMKGGSAALDEFGRQAEANGQLLGNNREVVEQANDAINNMKKAWGGMIQRVAILVAPWLEKTANLVARLVAGFTKLFGMGGSAQSTGGHAKAAAAAFVAPIDEAAKKAAEAAKKALATAAEDIAKRGADIAKSLRTPFEVFKDQAAELRELLANGGIGWETYGRAMRKAQADLKGARGEREKLETPGVAALTRRSAGGFSALQAAQRERADRALQHRETLLALAEITRAVLGSAIVISPRSI